MTTKTVLPQSSKRTMSSLSPTPILCTLLLINFLPLVTCAPSSNHRHPEDPKQEFETALDHFLNAYYDEMISKHLENHEHYKPTNSDEAASSKRAKTMVHDVAGRSTNKKQVDDAGAVTDTDIYDQMQGDQPVNDEPVGENGVILNYNDGTRNMTDQFIKNRDRLRKENWVEYLKSQILIHIGRSNSTFTKPPEDPPLTDFNITDIIPKILNTTTLDDDQITEKIRSFYPSCETPQNQDQDIWKDAEDIMNLYFDFDYNTDNKNSNIASATLRLYRLPQNGTVNTKNDECDNVDSVEEDKLLRVSVYWYTKLQKKRRVKRRLSDSKVVTENSRWVELSVKPATKAWNRAATKNLGLAILVEDQEGKALRADKFFKGASCTVGVSTPKPIPTIVRDASHVQADELDRIHSLLGRNSTTAVYSDLFLLPTVDICYLEFPDNTDISHYNSARINACNLRKIHEETQRLAERERVERLATLQFPSARHIRHQRQHRQSKLTGADIGNLKMADDFGNVAASGRQMSELESSLRSSINNKQIVFTREELEEFQRDRGLNR